MTLKVTIKNIGKLTDAEICIGGFTVLAGPNNTGKSFVSKLMYSLFSAMNANHIQIHVKNLIRPVVSSFLRLDRLVHHNAEKSKVLLEECNIEKLEALAEDCMPGDSKELDEIVSNLIHQTNEIEKKVNDIHIPEGIKEEAPGRQNETLQMTRMKEAQEELKKSLHKLKQDLSGGDWLGFIVAGMKYKIRQNLIHNFQIPTLSGLVGESDVPSELMFKDFGKFEFSNEHIEFAIDEILVEELQRHSNVIYLESPAYWKLKNALEDIRRNPRRLFLTTERELLSGVPEYFYDLIAALSFQRTGDIAFPDLYEKLTGKEVMGGKITISESGNLSFQENGHNFTLPLTAMGIVNLGILALLIERNILDKDTYVFIDEPEAHLHPAWQVVMAEVLFELSLQGVNVVIATHSVDILKWLEVHVKKNPEHKELVALNRFPINNGEADEDFETKMAEIKQELTKPFSDLYVKGLL